MFRYTCVLVLLFLVFSGVTKKACGTVVSGECGTSNVPPEAILQDTMFVNGRTRLVKTHDSQSERIASLNRCTVYVLNKTPVPNIQTTNVVDTFVLVRTPDDDTGYVWKKALITLSHLKARNDSLAMWAERPMPLYRELVGTSYWRNDELPFELSSGSFSSVGEGNRYGIVSVSNRYTGRYSYLFFIESTGRIREERHNELMIHDIIPLDWEKFGPDAQLGFEKCDCTETSEDCSDVIAVFMYTLEMARQGVEVTPIRAWRPDYSKPALVEIAVETVQCNIMAPEEYDPADYLH